MTEKALADKLSRLKAERKAKLSKASNIRDSMKNLITKGHKTMVCDPLYELRVVCDDAKSIHEQLLGFMPSDEQEKHEIWFKAKLLSLNECVRDAEMWVSNNEGNIQETVGVANIEDNANKNKAVSSKMVMSRTMKPMHMHMGWWWMTSAQMTAFLMWEANVQVKEVVPVEDQALLLHA